MLSRAIATVAVSALYVRVHVAIVYSESLRTILLLLLLLL